MVNYPDDFGRCSPEPLPAQRVPIRDIVVREEWQVRERINNQVVRQYATAIANGGNLPPIRLARVNGALILVDGWHRLAALEQLERSIASATVEDMTEEGARWEAAKANTTHGLPLKSKEKREVFRTYIRTKQNMDGRKYKSYRDIAADLNGIVSKSGVERWMRGDFPKVAERMAQDRLVTGERKVRTPPRLYDEAVKHLDQIMAGARGMPEGDRRKLAQQLTEAAGQVLNAAPWKEAQGGESAFDL